jgi:hypothetical protein
MLWTMRVHEGLPDARPFGMRDLAGGVWADLVFMVSCPYPSMRMWIDGGRIGGISGFGCYNMRARQTVMEGGGRWGKPAKRGA